MKLKTGSRDSLLWYLVELAFFVVSLCLCQALSDFMNRLSCCLCYPFSPYLRLYLQFLPFWSSFALFPPHQPTFLPAAVFLHCDSPLNFVVVSLISCGSAEAWVVRSSKGEHSLAAFKQQGCAGPTRTTEKTNIIGA